jgi:hypothetical protein
MTENKEFAYTTRQIVESKDSIEYGPAGQRVKLYFEDAVELARKMREVNEVVRAQLGAGQ